jgi:hypothetical protein
MPPYTSGPRKVAYALVALGCVFSALLSACKPLSAADPDSQGEVVKVAHRPDSVTGRPWTYLTIDFFDSRHNRTEEYTDKAKVADCKVGSVWPRCVRKT